MDDSTRQEAWLVLRAQLGDHGACEQILQRTQGWLQRYFVRLLNSPHEADDLLQDVLLTIYRQLGFLHEPRFYRTWVFRIATRLAFRRIHSRREALDLDAAGEPEADSVPPGELAPAELEQLKAGVGRLPPNSRAVIVLHYLEEMSLREVADVLELPVGTIKSRLAHGLSRLRRSVTCAQGRPAGDVGKA